jgi:L-aminopeptidase/D-esterase-like protein
LDGHATVFDEDQTMKVTGKTNSITDVAGLTAGHFSDVKAACGVTVVICEKGAVAGVDVRGAAPGTRETDLLNPINLVEMAQAVVLSGGSVYGLAASDGVVRWLAQKKLGFPVDAEHVAPIVPAAVLYDLGRGADFIPPVQAEWGLQACESAHTGPLEQGCCGAGTGAVSGGIKGGLGSASLVINSGITVAAVVAINSMGSVINPQTGRIWERDIEIDNEFAGQTKRRVQLLQADTASPATNTTIGIVATDAILTKVQATKIAQMAHDGLARAIRPSHTMFDGDTIFCLATGQKELPVGDDFFPGHQAPAINDIGHAAADCMTRAIIHGVLKAKTMGSFPAFEDLDDLD